MIKEGIIIALLLVAQSANAQETTSEIELKPAITVTPSQIKTTNTMITPVQTVVPATVVTPLPPKATLPKAIAAPVVPLKMSFAEKHPKLKGAQHATISSLKEVVRVTGKSLVLIEHQTSETLIWVGNQLESYEPLLKDISMIEQGMGGTPIFPSTVKK